MDSDMCYSAIQAKGQHNAQPVSQNYYSGFNRLILWE